MLLLLCSLFIWQAFYTKDKNSNNILFTTELTRANGAEESARMHPDNNHLYYLKKHSENTRYQLWVKNIHTAKIRQVDIVKDSISQIIAIVAGVNSDTTNMFYLDKKQEHCGVYQATLTQNKPC